MDAYNVKCSYYLVAWQQPILIGRNTHKESCTQDFMTKNYKFYKIKINLTF